MQEKKVINKYLIRAIIFDLDDTIIDTYGTLIRRFETDRADRINKLIPDAPSPDELLAFLLELRRKQPETMENDILKRFPSFSKELCSIRKEVEEKLPMGKVFVRPGVYRLLDDLSDYFDLYLLTEGEEGFQNRKLQQIAIEKFFKDILIVAASPYKAKYEAIKHIVWEEGYDLKSTLIVGNRLDKEIRAGNEIGIPTLRVRYGEGSDMIPTDDIERPDYEVDNVTEIWDILRGI